MASLLQTHNVIFLAALATLGTGIATGLGALPTLLTVRVSDKLLDGLLGFAAGVMLAATSFSLLIPSMETGGIWVTVVGVVVGAAFVALMDRVVPHMHFISGPEGPPSATLKRITLLILAITIHNFPEGLAVGVGFGGGDLTVAVALAIAIALQNMPEGLAVALPLVREGYSRWKAIGYALLSGLVEPIGGVLGAALVSVARPILPWGLSFAAGAMLYVVSEEMIPETHRKGFAKVGTTGLLVGFVVMMTLDNLFG
ncbi:MAG: ZIP family metal transporter [Anaerolineae bacterium]|jgi:ZIP family zinc transporter|nr:ZIP family metal transporter [Anaerolineae bacterium]